MSIYERFTCWIIGCLMMISVSLFGQAIHGGNIQFNVDMARFKAKNDLTLLELYISVPRNEIEHRKEDSQYRGIYEIGVNIYFGDSLLSTSTKQMVDRANSLDEITKRQLLFNIFSFSIQKGDYKIQTRVTDQFRNIGGWYEQGVTITPFADTSLSVSDIQISTQIVADQSSNPLVKNGYRIIPYPSKLFGIELPVLYYYLEIYNLSTMDAGEDSTYRVQLSVIDMNGNVITEVPSVNKKRVAASIIEVGQINAANLFSGNYKIKLDVTDQATGKTVSGEKGFSVYRPVDFITENKLETPIVKRIDDMYAGITEEEIDKQFEYCYFIVTKEEKNVYQKLDLDGKRGFMTEFWVKHNNNPLVPANLYRDEYLRRINYANMNFSHGGREGWKMDSGRIYIKYGEPDDIDRYPSSLDVNPYEVWKYYGVEGGVEFYFVDEVGMGEMRLVHSTAVDEIQDYDWQRYLDPSGISDLNEEN